MSTADLNEISFRLCETKKIYFQFNFNFIYSATIMIIGNNYGIDEVLSLIDYLLNWIK